MLCARCYELAHEGDRRTSLAVLFGLFELLALFAFVRGRWRWPAAGAFLAVPEYAYEARWLDTRLPFEELRKRSRINAVAAAAGTGPDFSQWIRAGLPDPMEAHAEAERMD